MIRVTRFNGTKLYLNAEMIQSVEGTPDAVITLINNVKVIVRETPEEIVKQMIEYHQKVRNPNYQE